MSKVDKVLTAQETEAELISLAQLYSLKKGGTGQYIKITCICINNL